MKKLLIEYNALCPDGICNIDVLNEEERRLKKDGYYILTGILQAADTKNGNGRIYPRKILEREINNYQKAIREKRAIGECDHPNLETVSLQNASHMVLRTWWNGDDVWGSVKVLKNTPAGQILEGLLKDGVQLGISSRGLGTVDETPDGIIVKEDFQLIAFDIVSEPSTPDAYMFLKEGKEIKNINEKEIFSKADRINRCLNDILGL